jgi:hypothetical protein
MVHLLGEIITGKGWGGNGFITLCVMAFGRGASGGPRSYLFTTIFAPPLSPWTGRPEGFLGLCVGEDLSGLGRIKQGERARRGDRPFSLDSARARAPLRPGLPAARLPVTFFIL